MKSRALKNEKGQDIWLPFNELVVVESVDASLVDSYLNDGPPFVTHSIRVALQGRDITMTINNWEQQMSAPTPGTVFNVGLWTGFE